MSWMSTYYFGPNTFVINEPEIVEISEIAEIIDVCENEASIMSNTFVIYQGDTPEARRINFDSIDVSQCTCRQVVRRSLHEPPVIDDEVTAKLTVDSIEYFHVFLTPTQTDGLSPGEWDWIVELHAADTTPPIKREIHRRLKVNPQASET